MAGAMFSCRMNRFRNAVTMCAYANVMAIVLGFVSALMPSVYSQEGELQSRRPPPRLYQVSRWDEKSHRKRIGFIDKSGRLVIGFDRLPETTKHVGEFNEGRAVIVVAAAKERKEPGGCCDEKVGFIDETGSVVIAPRFISAHNFSEGLAFAWGNGFMGFIDREGKEVFKVAEYTVGDFHDGLAALRPGGYIDRAGGLVIKGYTFADDFSEGLAGVEVAGGILKRFGFINTKGEMAIPPRFPSRIGGDAMITVATSRFSEGLASVKGEGSYGYIDKSGRFVIAPQFQEAQEFSEGLAWVKTFQGKTGWIDKSGRWAIVVEDGKVYPSGILQAAKTATIDSRFSEGLVPFVTYSKNRTFRGYMDRKGEVIIQPREFDSAGPSRGGLARVTFYEPGEYWEGKMGYFDRATKRFMEKKYGYIDRAGRFVWRSQ